jgi:hypothetical protein
LHEDCVSYAAVDDVLIVVRRYQACITGAIENALIANVRVDFVPPVLNYFGIRAVANIGDGHSVIPVLGVLENAEADLPEIGGTRDLAALFADPGEDGVEYGTEQANYYQNDEQLDE